MIRFYMPGGDLSAAERREQLNKQFDAFLRSEAFAEILSVTGTDAEGLARIYGARRKASGGIMETQDMEASPELEEHREILYPLFQELGFIDINEPLDMAEGCPTRIVILGGALGTCFDRIGYSRQYVTAGTASVDALTCYRPINPVERRREDIVSSADTEFGAMGEAMEQVYGLKGKEWTERFSGDRNLNSISCIRAYDSGRYRLFSAPSQEPDRRRADTGDCLCFYLDETRPGGEDSILAITSNRYCNRQFIQMAYEMIGRDCPAHLDVIGCRRGETLHSVEDYDPLQYMQDLIGILDWIERFGRL